MVKISLPYKPDVPATTPNMRVSVAPSPHIRFTEDVGYYDAMGRDPLQMFQVWGIKDPIKRISKLEEILPEWPGPRHQRHMLADAACRGDEAIVRFLIDTGLKVHPDIPGRNGIPSQEPEPDSEMGDDEMNDVEMDDVETDDGEGKKDDVTVAPLHIAATYGHLECVRIILEGGKMDVDVLDEFGRTPLCAAAQGGSAEVIGYLLNQGANPTIRLDGDSKLTQKYFDDLANADALELAAQNSTPETVRLLLEHPLYGSKRSRKYVKGSGPGVYVTPIAVLRAATGGDIDTLKYLLERGSYPLTEKEGKPKGELLDEAQKRDIENFVPDIIHLGNYNAIQMMLSYIYPINEEGEVTPFTVPDDMHRHFTWGAYEAVMRNDLKKFEWIYRFGIKEHDLMSVEEFPKDQHLNIQNLLDKATEAGSLDCIKMLIEKYGAQPDATRLPPGKRPIYTAAMNDQPEAVRYYLENHEIDLHFGNGSFIAGPTALYTAISMKSLDSIELLLMLGGPVDHVDDEIIAIDKPIKAVLITERETRTPIRLQTEANATDYIEKMRQIWEELNPRYVRLELDSDDKEWISKLVPRKSNDELKESDVTDRRLDSDDKTREDPTPYLVAYPCSGERSDKLAKDDDIIPEWKPMFVPA